jgi:hypothetical protein
VNEGEAVVRWLRPGIVVALLAAAVAASFGGGSGAAAAPTPDGIGWTGDGAIAWNGTLPTRNPAKTCGSATDGYLAELIHVSPQDAKVKDHWADVVPGKDMMAAGVVEEPSLGTGDLPFDHTFGSDLNLNLKLDAPYARLGQGGDGGDGTVHVELSEGLLPHSTVTAGPARGQEWQAMSDAARQDITDGFVPQPGDRAVVMGRWILDCGHAPGGTEIHPVTFMAFGHTEGDVTTVHFMSNPYRDTQRYNPDLTLANKVNDPSRLARADTYPFPQGLVAEVIRVIQGKDDHLIAPELLEANSQDAAPWTVCAPDSAQGQYPAWQAHTSIRSNVYFSIDPVPGSRCVSITSRRTAGYRAPQPRFRLCDNPWDWLNTQAAGEAGVPNLDVQQLIKDQVPQQYWPAIDETPESVCWDPLKGKAIDALDNQVEVDDSQAFAFYGVIEVGASDTVPPTSSTTTTSTSTSTSTTSSVPVPPAAPVSGGSDFVG